MRRRPPSSTCGGGATGVSAVLAAHCAVGTSMAACPRRAAGVHPPSASRKKEKLRKPDAEWPRASNLGDAGSPQVFVYYTTWRCHRPRPAAWQALRRWF